MPFGAVSIPQSESQTVSVDHQGAGHPGKGQAGPAFVWILSIHLCSPRRPTKKGPCLTCLPPAAPLPTAPQPLPAIPRSPHTAWRPQESGTRILGGSGKPSPASHPANPASGNTGRTSKRPPGGPAATAAPRSAPATASPPPGRPGQPRPGGDEAVAEAERVPAVA